MAAAARSIGAKLVYERVRPSNGFASSHRGMTGCVLADCIEVKDGPFREYLVDELTKRADYRCAATVEEFRSQRRAVTREGQVRSGERHEKDDRHRVDDPRRGSSAGSTNERSPRCATELARAGADERETAAAEVGDAQDAAGRRCRQAGALLRVEGFRSWTDLDRGRGRVARERP